MIELKDINGVTIEVGNSIYRAVQSWLIPCIVLGFTDKSIIVSCFKVIRWGSKYNQFNALITEHNDREYISRYNFNCVFKNEQEVIPEKLLKYIRYERK